MSEFVEDRDYFPAERLPVHGPLRPLTRPADDAPTMVEALAALLDID